MLSGSLVHEGRRQPVSGGVTIGRSDENDLVVADERASRRHARVWEKDGVVVISDLESRHGTLLNGQPIGEGEHELRSGDEIAIGDQVLRFISGQETRMASREQAVAETVSVAIEGDRVAIGRDDSNDVVLADPNVSRFHAEVLRVGDGFEIRDPGSRNGTRVDGEIVERAALTPRSQIGIGPYRILFDGRTLVARDDHGALRLDGRGVGVTVKGKQILAPTDVVIEPGELVAVIGESGAGKSTLLKAIAGVNPATEGTVTVNDEPLATRLTDIGYVPQDDIVHGFLTVREALTYAARLRLPADAGTDEIEAAVDRVLGELSLDEHADTAIGSLSGGQRKRTGVAAELLNRPSLLFLDEPTTGLDPGLETQMMRLLRELADRGRGVALVTHATKNLALCDRVVVMGRGGQRAFDGPPADALRFFGVEDYDEVYTALASRPPEQWRAAFDRNGGGGIVTTDAAAPAQPAERSRRRTGRRPLPQVRLLTSRYARLFTRDRKNLALLIGQAPVLGLFNVALFESGVFDLPGGNAGDAVQLLFLLAITTIWLGAIDAAPEIVKERAIFERERAVGMRQSAYLISKVVVLFALIVVQVVLYLSVTLIFRPLDASAETYVGVFALLVATGFAAIGLGLLVSSAVGSQDQAMSIIPLAIIPQLLFAGSIVPLARMAEPAHTLAYAIASQWSLAALGTEEHMNARLAADPEFSRVNRFGTHFFDVAFSTGVLVQLAFFAVCLGGAALLLLRSRAG